MIVAGFGFRGGASADSLRDALDRTGAAPDLLATAAAKAGAAPIRALARALDRPLRAVDPAALSAQDTPTRSEAARRSHATGSVAEAAALAAAGPGAVLVAPRCISADRMATCAIARGPDP